MDGERHGRLVYIYKVYLVYRELCHLVQYTCPIALPLISGLLSFNCEIGGFQYLGVQDRALKLYPVGTPVSILNNDQETVFVMVYHVNI